VVTGGLSALQTRIPLETQKWLRGRFRMSENAKFQNKLLPKEAQFQNRNAS
jgi:hypothetical protein